MIKPGLLASALLGIVLLAFAVSVDFPKANGGGFKADESTYYVLAHSLTNDLDFQFERKDLIRVWEEFPGPEGIFLKRGKDIEVRGSSSFPFLRWIKHEDPERETRLYFSKSYIYPLVASPFVYIFGTNGFLVFHAILLALDFLVIYLFIQATTKSNWVSLPLTAAFLGVSLVPVYFVWLMPELFNFSFVLYAVFFWAYKEVARDRLGRGTKHVPGRPGVGLRGSRAARRGDVLEAAAPADPRPHRSARAEPPAMAACDDDGDRVRSDNGVAVRGQCRHYR